MELESVKGEVLVPKEYIERLRDVLNNIDILTVSNKRKSLLDLNLKSETCPREPLLRVRIV